MRGTMVSRCERDDVRHEEFLLLYLGGSSLSADETIELHVLSFDRYGREGLQGGTLDHQCSELFPTTPRTCRRATHLD